MVRILGARCRIRILQRKPGSRMCFACLTPVHVRSVSRHWAKPASQTHLQGPEHRAGAPRGLGALAAATRPHPGIPCEGDLGSAVDIGTTPCGFCWSARRRCDRRRSRRLQSADPQRRRRHFPHCRGRERLFGRPGVVYSRRSFVDDRRGGQPAESADTWCGNATMIHLLLAADPSGIRRVPSAPLALAFPPSTLRSSAGRAR